MRALILFLILMALLIVKLLQGFGETGFMKTLLEVLTLGNYCSVAALISAIATLILVRRWRRRLHAKLIARQVLPVRRPGQVYSLFDEMGL